MTDEIQLNAWGNYQILYHQTNKETLTVLCSVVKHLGSSRAIKKWGKTLNYFLCYPLHYTCVFPCRLLACFTTEQSIFEASLFVKLSHLLQGTVDYKGGRKLRLRKAVKKEVWNLNINLSDWNIFCG